MPNILVDASSPIRFTAQNDGAGASAVSATFTPPDNSFLVVCAQVDTTSGGSETGSVTVSGGGLTWTQRVERTGTEASSGGASSIHTARVTTGSLMTVTVTRTAATGSGGRISAKCRVLTNVDVDGTPVDAVGANNEGGDGANNINTTSLTPGADGMLVAADCDWTVGAGTNTAFEAPSDGSTQDTTAYSGEIAVCDGTKLGTSGVPISMNFNAGGTGSASHKWCQIFVRAAASTGVTMTPAQAAASLAGGGLSLGFTINMPDEA